MPAILDGDTLPKRTYTGKSSATSGAGSKRPFRLAADGYAAPTALEVEEGAAHKEWWALLDQLKRSPLSRILRAEKEAAEKEWERLSMALYAIQPHPATTRCPLCHVRLFARVSCLSCGEAAR